MRIANLLLWAVSGWCAVGLLGTLLSLARGRRAEASKHAAWIAVVAGIYLLTLLGVSAIQGERTFAVGQDRCFGTMCFRVTGVDEVPGLVTGDDSRVVRVVLTVANRSKAADEEASIRAYLVDSRGREWFPLPGLFGNRMNTRVAAGSEIISQPIFRVANDSSGLKLILAHGSWQSRQLTIGDPESLGHRPSVIELGR